MDGVEAKAAEKEEALTVTEAPTVESVVLLLEDLCCGQRRWMR